MFDGTDGKRKRWSGLAERAAAGTAVMAGSLGIGTAIVVAARAAEAGQPGEKAGAVALVVAVSLGLTTLAVALIRRMLQR